MMRTWTLKAALAAAVGVGALQAGAAPAFAQSGDKVTLNWALWDWSAVAYYQPLIDAYQAKNPNVTITHTDLGSTDYNQMLMTQLTGGSKDLDIVTVKDIPGYAQLVGTGALADLTASAAGDLAPGAFGGLIEALTVDGKLHAIPFRADFWIVYYNKRLFDAAGEAYPTNDMTWEAFDALARKMTTGFGASKVYGTHLHTWRSTVQLPAVLDGEHTVLDGEYGFLKPWYERALALQSEGVVQSYGALKTSKTHYSGPFYNEQIAMLPMGSWFIGTQIAKVKSGESLAKDWGIASFPHAEGIAPGTTAAQVTSLGVNANSPDREAATAFVEWVAGPEGAAVLAATGSIPARSDDSVLDVVAAKDGFPQDEGSRNALKVTRSFLEMPVDPLAAQIELVLNRAHDSIMTDNISVDDGIAEMNEGVKALK